MSRRKNHWTREDFEPHYSYDPNTGLVTRKSTGYTSDKWCRIRGYPSSAFRETSVRAHVIAWVLLHGKTPEPPLVIDHIDGDRTNNRAFNLRALTNQANVALGRGSPTGSSGLRGASRVKGRERWRSCIADGAHALHLGYFNTPQEAHEAYLAARKALKDSRGF